MTAKAKKGEEVVPLLTFSGDRHQQMQQLYDRWYGCAKCHLFETRPSPELVFCDGDENAKMLIVGEGPGEVEETEGVPFVGPSGHLLNQMLAFVSDDPDIQEMSVWYDKAPRTKENRERFHEAVYKWRRREFFVTNAVCCRPPENRAPTGFEVKACFDRLRHMIYIVDPLVIITVGKTALEALTHKTTEVTQKRGQLHEIEIDGRVGRVKYPVMPVLHPSYLLRKADWKVKDGDYAKTLKDFYRAMRLKDELMLRYHGVPLPHRVEPK